MIDETAAKERAVSWLRERGAERMAERMQLTEFDHGWLASFGPHSLDEATSVLRLGGIRLIVDKEDGSVQATPVNRSAKRIMREYSDRKEGRNASG